MTLSEISAEITRLKNLEKELILGERAKYLEEAKKNIGRCFRISNNVYAKVLDVPQSEPTLHGDHFNRHHYPGVTIDLNNPAGHRNFYGEYDFGIEFDTVFSGVWGEGRQVEGCEEITQEEFEEAFIKRLEEIKDFVLEK